MAAKLIASLLTLLTNACVAVIVLFFMLVAMNGFSESDASWGLGAFLLLAVVISLGTAGASYFLVQLLKKKNYSSAAAAIISIAVCVPVGIVAEVISSLVGIGIADFVRRNY